jgi:hypothetical protein
MQADPANWVGRIISNLNGDDFLITQANRTTWNGDLQRQRGFRVGLHRNGSNCLAKND